MTRDDSIRFRRATIADAEPLAIGVLEGIEDYPSFAPPGWTAPSLDAELEHLRESLADEDVCCLVADSGGEVIGQITVLPAARAPHPVDDASLAHISNLFVRRDHWGAGLAGDLHRAPSKRRASAASPSCGSSWPPGRQGPGASMNARDGYWRATRSTTPSRASR